MGRVKDTEINIQHRTQVLADVPVCKATRRLDEMRCERCNLTWSADEEKPPCKTNEEAKAMHEKIRADTTLKELKGLF